MKVLSQNVHVSQLISTILFDKVQVFTNYFYHVGYLCKLQLKTPILPNGNKIVMVDCEFERFIINLADLINKHFN